MSEPVASPVLPVPAPLKVAAGGVLLEGIACLVFAVLDAVHVTRGGLQLGLTAAGFFVLYGLGLGWCAWGLRNRRRAARGPVLFSELAMLGLAWNAAHAGNVWLTVVMVIAAVVVLAGLLSPASVAALEDDEDADEPSSPTR